MKEKIEAAWDWAKTNKRKVLSGTAGALALVSCGDDANRLSDPIPVTTEIGFVCPDATTELDIFVRSNFRNVDVTCSTPAGDEAPTEVLLRGQEPTATDGELYGAVFTLNSYASHATETSTNGAVVTLDFSANRDVVTAHAAFRTDLAT